MARRTLVLLAVTLAVTASTFVVSSTLGYPLLFVPLFLVWSWGERGRVTRRERMPERAPAPVTPAIGTAVRPVTLQLVHFRPGEHGFADGPGSPPRQVHPDGTQPHSEDVAA
jgi:hypothetical protein